MLNISRNCWNDKGMSLLSFESRNKHGPLLYIKSINWLNGKNKLLQRYFFRNKNKKLLIETSFKTNLSQIVDQISTVTKILTAMVEKK